MSISFITNVVSVDMSQTVGSITFLSVGSTVTLANGSNSPNVTTAPFGTVTVTGKNGVGKNYMLKDDYHTLVQNKTYTINGPSGDGIVSIVDPDGVTVARFQQ